MGYNHFAGVRIPPGLQIIIFKSKCLPWHIKIKQMPELKKHEDIKVAVVIDGSTYLTSEEGVLYEFITDNEALFYLKSRDGKKEIKIKINK
jgi:hypothetical protein